MYKFGFSLFKIKKLLLIQLLIPNITEVILPNVINWSCPWFDAVARQLKPMV